MQAFIIFALIVLYYLVSRFINEFLSTKDGSNPVFSKSELMEMNKIRIKALGRYSKVGSNVDEKEYKRIWQDARRTEDKYNFIIQANIDVSNGKKTMKEVLKELHKFNINEFEINIKSEDW